MKGNKRGFIFIGIGKHHPAIMPPLDNMMWLINYKYSGGPWYALLLTNVTTKHKKINLSPFFVRAFGENVLKALSTFGTIFFYIEFYKSRPKDTDDKTKT